MKNYFEKLQKKVDRYKDKYRKRPRRAALKLAWWNFKCIFKRHKFSRHINPVPQNINVSSPNINLVSPTFLDTDVLKIGISEKGGLGDSLMQTLYIKQIKKMFDKPVQVDFYCKGINAYKLMPFIDHCYSIDNCQIDLDKYDVFLKGRRFYTVQKINREKVRSFSEQFYKFCVDCENLKSNDLWSNVHDSFCDNLYTQYALLHGKNRLEQANVHGILDVCRNSSKYLNWDIHAFFVLEKYELKDVPYITISRAVDSKYGENHTKLWLLGYYYYLVKMFKEKYPDIKIVQIGANTKFSSIDGVDLDLLGKTSIDETKVLLKNALLHIDNEGGLVHTRNFLYGKSVVLFGPTSPDVFGYKENINLRTNACPMACEWTTLTWFEKCDLGHICVKSLKPEFVFEKVSEYIERLPSYRYEEKELTESLSEIKGKKIAIIGRAENLEIDLKKNDVSLFDDDMSVPSENYKNNCGFIQHFAEQGGWADYAFPYNIPSWENEFDYVFINNVDKYANFDFVLKEAKRIVKVGGEIFYTTKNKEVIIRKFIDEKK